MSAVQLEAIDEHRDSVSRLFWDNMLIGQSLPFQLTCRTQFEQFCLDWYFANSADSAVAVKDGRVVGYALVCIDHDSFHRGERRNLARLVLSLIVALVTFRANRQSIEFYARRLRDSVSLLASRRQIPDDVDVHAHVNIDHAHHNGVVARTLRDHIDGRCMSLGRRGWFGEMNAVGGSRVVGLQRVVGHVVSVEPNHTFSWLLGQPVSRLTTVRTMTDREAA